jgi:hypothetical protein
MRPVDDFPKSRASGQGVDGVFASGDERSGCERRFSAISVIAFWTERALAD